MHLPAAVLCDLRIHLVYLPDKIRGQHFPGSSLGNDTAFFQRINTIAEHRCDIQVVDSGYHSRRQIFYDPHDLELVGNVQMVGRFIQDQAGRLLSQRSCQDHPLLR